MTTYLFTWNPARWNWPYLRDSIKTIKQTGHCHEHWGCAATKKIRPGDRAFLMKLGQEPRGLMGSGWVVSEVYDAQHWGSDDSGKLTRYVEIDWETLLDPTTDLFPREWLTSPVYAKMRWAPRASGARIPDDVAAQLEQDWAKFLARPNINNG
jgi:5-methylcytosine-specific restriction protein A